MSSLCRAAAAVCHQRRRCFFHSSIPRCALHHEWIQNTSKHSENTVNNDEEKEDDSSTIVFLHGLLGSGKNLKTLARKVTNGSSTNSRGVLMDLRGHGKAPSLEAPHSFDACVQDVHKTLSSTTSDASTMDEPPSLVMGHSWGGRIALQYVHSLLESDKELPSLWLLDTVPGQAHDSVEKVLDAVQSIPSLQDRKQVAFQLQESGLQPEIAQWLASSLKKRTDDPSRLQWGFDVDVVKNILPEFHHQDFVGMLHEILKEGGNVNLVRGGLNTAWEESPFVLQQMKELQQDYPHQFEFHTLPNAGHWVHVDDLPGLLEIVHNKSS